MIMRDGVFGRVMGPKVEWVTGLGITVVGSS